MTRIKTCALGGTRAIRRIRGDTLAHERKTSAAKQEASKEAKAQTQAWQDKRECTPTTRPKADGQKTSPGRAGAW